MAHLDLARFVAAHPHAGRLRARSPRRLRPIRPSRKNELWYRTALREIVRACRKAGDEVAAALRSHWPRTFVADWLRTPYVPKAAAGIWPLVQSADAAASVAAIPGADTAFDAAVRKFGNIEMVARRLANIATKINLQEVDDRLAKEISRSVAIDISPVLTTHGPIAQAMEKAARANAELITSIPAQYLDEVKNAVSEAWAAGKRWETLVDEIGHIGDVTDSRAKLIARDQTSKLTAAFNEVRQTGLGIAKYRWHGALDQRERASHIRMEGSLQRWDSRPMVDGEPVHPGEAINCRCWAVAEFELDEMEAAA